MERKKPKIQNCRYKRIKNPKNLILKSLKTNEKTLKTKK